ncbi:MAG: hypothetical protein M1824_003838 [Vezdaea acicularis]|nr:MAG: hypothetical protein M1824_003838 [Vezdaea acicularis]
MAIGVAIIGGGIFAKEQHLPAVQDCPQLSLKAIYSRSLKSAQSLSEGLQGLELYSEDAGPGKGYADLLRRADILGVIIALPIVVQPDFIRTALRAGKHVLSEKPVAATVAYAEALVSEAKDSVTWSVAENFRFLDSFIYGQEEVKNLGKILGFRVKRFSPVKQGWKFFETPWRKTPEYQGGFLLDGGVHVTAGLRMLLAPDLVTSTHAFTTQLREHLPPVDTVDAILKTKAGVQGALSISFGTTLNGSEYTIICETGSVSVYRGSVTVRSGIEGEDAENTKEFPDEGSGVRQEVKAWAEGIATGTQNSKLDPAEAIMDLKVLEAMLRSGEENGTIKEVI